MTYGRTSAYSIWLEVDVLKFEFQARFESKVTRCPGASGELPLKNEKLEMRVMEPRFRYGIESAGNLTFTDSLPFPISKVLETTFQADDWSVARCPCRWRHCHNLYHIVPSPMGCTTFPEH